MCLASMTAEKAALLLSSEDDYGYLDYPDDETVEWGGDDVNDDVNGQEQSR